MPLTRRELLAGLATASVTSALTDLGFAQSDASKLRIDATRLQQSLEGLSVYGRPAGGSFADGVSRVAYSDADIAGRKYAMRWNVVIGGQLFSKSFLGYTTYKMGLVTREGLLMATVLTVLPFAILWVLVKVLPPWPAKESHPLPSVTMAD